MKRTNVNKTFWDKIGALDEQGSPKAPKDWDELEDLLTKLTQAAPAQGLSVDWGWNFILYSYAGGILALKGDIYGPDGNMLDVESDAALRWLEMNRRWIEKGIAAEGTITDVNFGRDNFNAGIIPMIYTAHSRFIEGGADLGEENTSAIPLPGALDNGTIVYTHTIYLCTQGITEPGPGQAVHPGADLLQVVPAVELQSLREAAGDHRILRGLGLVCGRSGDDAQDGGKRSVYAQVPGLGGAARHIP
ncbi:MAG: extracellular solute-binding protein [Firmicutes bacterium]|nr:extracellular solute-binding protein [Bacillota bacterium]